jgi:hypothetical protein
MVDGLLEAGDDTAAPRRAELLLQAAFRGRHPRGQVGGECVRACRITAGRPVAGQWWDQLHLTELGVCPLGLAAQRLVPLDRTRRLESRLAFPALAFDDRVGDPAECPDRPAGQCQRNDRRRQDDD